MKITNYQGGGPNKYEILDDCPVCFNSVTSFGYNYSPKIIDVIEYGNPCAVYTKASGITFTFYPCKHVTTDTVAIDWQTVRCATKQQYNKEVIRSVYRSNAKKDRAFAKAFGAGDVRL